MTTKKWIPSNAFEVRNAQAEAYLKKIGDLFRETIPEGYGFAFLLFGYENKELFYTSNAERDGVIATMREFIAKFEHN